MVMIKEDNFSQIGLNSPQDLEGMIFKDQEV